MAILENIPDEIYHNMDGISSTALKIFIQNPVYYFNKFINKSCPVVKSDAMTFGSALHTYVLEPHLFDNRFIVKPEEMNFATKEGKEFKNQNINKSFITNNELLMIKTLRENAIKKMPASWFTQKTYFELALTSKIKEADIRGKVDWLIEFDDRIINLDLKTTTSLDDNKIRWTVRDFMYHVQGNMYTRLISDNFWKPTENYLLFCDKTTLDCRLVNIDNLVINCEKLVYDSILALHNAKITKQFKSIYNEVFIL